MKTRLALRAETLGELNASELTSVVAASGLPCDLVNTRLLTGICPTFECTGCYVTCTC